MAAPYRLLRHTADLRLSVTAPDFPALCARGALALSSLVTDRRSVRPSSVRRLPVPAVAGEDGFLSFLRSAFLLLSAERFLVRSAEAFPVTGGGGWSVSLSGEEAEPSRHRFPREVKAVTRHAVEVVRLPSGLLRARFVVDV